MGERIVVTSGKGGVGKTTVTLNIGAALALRGKRVALVDTDLGLRNLDVVMGVEDKIVFDLVDVVEGRCRLKQALVQDVRFSGRLVLLPAAQTRDKDTVSAQQMRQVVAELAEQFDYVLIDCPAGIEQGFKNAVAGADQAIVVTMPEISAVRDADRVIGLLLAYDIPSPRLVVNRLHAKLVRRGDMMSLRDTVEVLGIPLLGVLPDEDSVIRAGNLGQPVVLDQNHDPSHREGRVFPRVAVIYRKLGHFCLGQFFQRCETLLVPADLAIAVARLAFQHLLAVAVKGVLLVLVVAVRFQVLTSLRAGRQFFSSPFAHYSFTSGLVWPVFGIYLKNFFAAHNWLLSFRSG